MQKNPMFLSLRELLMPLQSLPCAEVSARLVGGQGACGEENGTVRKVGRLGTAFLHGSPQCWAGQAPGWAGCGQHGGPLSHWVADVGL